MGLQDYLLNEGKSAEDEYNKRRAAIDKMIKSLEKKLAQHEDQFADTEYKGWGYVGDLGNIEKKLKEIVEFIK